MSMKIHLAWITPKAGRRKSSELAALVDQYIVRGRQYAEISTLEARSEEQLFAAIARLVGRTTPQTMLLDSRGRQRTSEELAELLRASRDGSVQHLVFAIGGPDGWSAAARQRASELLSLGKLTLPHELARLIMAEQIYRALTILAGHPYHSGH